IAVASAMMRRIRPPDFSISASIVSRSLSVSISISSGMSWSVRERQQYSGSASRGDSVAPIGASAGGGLQPSLDDDHSGSAANPARGRARSAEDVDPPHIGGIDAGENKLGWHIWRLRNAVDHDERLASAQHRASDAHAVSAGRRAKHLDPRGTPDEQFLDAT